MPPRRSSKKDSPVKLAGRMKRRWRVVLLRSKGEIPGTVEAPDVASAKAALPPGFPGAEVDGDAVATPVGAVDAAGGPPQEKPRQQSLEESLLTQTIDPTPSPDTRLERRSLSPARRYLGLPMPSH